jgi:hypothetical protein
MGALLMETHDAWQSGKIYLDLTTYLFQQEQVVTMTNQKSVA